MLTYLSEVEIVDSSFYQGVRTRVLDKRLHNGKPEYLVDLQPTRWISETKLRLVADAKETQEQH